MGLRRGSAGGVIAASWFPRGAGADGVTLYLLNDTVLEVGSTMGTPPDVVERVGRTSMDEVLSLVGQAFARDPCFARSAQAKRAALMLLLKAPTHNAALFVATPQGVQARLASVDHLVLFLLKGQQDRGVLGPGEVNARVWTQDATTP
jgi:hypothetical protein